MKKIRSKKLGAFLGFLTGLCNGLFGAGGGILVVPTFIYFMDLSVHEAHATALAVILPISIVSAIIYYKSGIYDWDIIYKVAVGGILGGIIGSNLLGKIPSYWLRKTFSIFMILAALRMIV
ncbi:MAG TPA: sulfite exporter TauE/SafE family protein [Clostridiales bacterium]|mgnify:CR=1 FL=1|nr:sulfite exporter TauE/SafE family protein [Clostridiales bacterium]